MPYITPARRAEFDSAIEVLLHRMNWKQARDGDVNYILTRLIAGYYKADQGYERMARGLACFEAAKLEYSRRVMAPYEDLKMKENGDVF